MGRPWPQPGEPLFTDEDTTEILDYLADENLLCPGCGEPKVESMDPANEGRYRAVVLQCHACSPVKKAAKKLDDADGVYAFPMKR